MKKSRIILLTGAAAFIVIASVMTVQQLLPENRKDSSIANTGGADEPTPVIMTGMPEEGTDKVVQYQSITMKEAEERFLAEGDYIILDVRRADEFAEGHIPGAVNVANEDILSSEPAELPDKYQTIYVYCRSGRRSREASAKLTALGYTDIIEFGGILDWKGEIEK